MGNLAIMTLINKPYGNEAEWDTRTVRDRVFEVIELLKLGLGLRTEWEEMVG